jgi:hypothetical protein
MHSFLHSCHLAQARKLPAISKSGANFSRLWILSNVIGLQETCIRSFNQSEGVLYNLSAVVMLRKFYLLFISLFVYQCS